MSRSAVEPALPSARAICRGPRYLTAREAAKLAIVGAAKVSIAEAAS